MEDSGNLKEPEPLVIWKTPHCLKRNQNPCDDSLRGTSISLPNFVIRCYFDACFSAF
nr:MAG TPA: hypothetical protein [Caudoviricetes sp.]